MAITPIKIAIYLGSTLATLTALTGLGYYYSNKNYSYYPLDHKKFVEDFEVIELLNYTTDRVPDSSWANNPEFKKQKYSRFKDTIGKSHSTFVISPDTNQALWENNYKRLSKDRTKEEKLIDDKLSGIDSAFSLDKLESNSLNNFCRMIYEFADDNFFNHTVGTNNKGEAIKELNVPLVKNFFSYCSFIGEEADLMPKTFECTQSRDKKFADCWALFWPTDEKQKVYWAMKQYWYDTLKDDERWEIEDVEQFVSRYPDIKEDNRVSIRKFCSYATQESIDTKQKDRKWTIKLRTIWKYCSNIEFDFGFLFNIEGTDYKYDGSSK